MSGGSNDAHWLAYNEGHRLFPGRRLKAKKRNPMAVQHRGTNWTPEELAGANGHRFLGGGLMRCRRNVAVVVPRPKRLFRTRSRICAVSISGDYVHPCT